jgi:hypothetical protein
MGKKEGYLEILTPHLEDYLQNGESRGLKEAIETHSNLPSPRANLEFAAAFEEYIVERVEDSAELLWELCNQLVKLSPEGAPVNDPKEFLPFCGTLGLGAVGSEVEDYYEEVVIILKALSRDRRWRMREAVRMSLQKLLRRNPQRTLEVLHNWILEGDPLEMRAVVTAVSDPELFQDQKIVDRVARFHKEIMDQIEFIQDRKTKPFRALRKALGYTISILVCAQPEVGWRLIDELIHSKDTDFHWIARSNLKRRRLLRDFPEEVKIKKQGF